MQRVRTTVRLALHRASEDAAYVQRVRTQRTMLYTERILLYSACNDTRAALHNASEDANDVQRVRTS